jgi:hypothetical protein
MRHASLSIALVSLVSMTAACAGGASYSRTQSAYASRTASSGGAEMPVAAPSSDQSYAATEAPWRAPMTAPMTPRPVALGAAFPARAAHGTTPANSALRPSTAEGGSATVQQTPANVMLIYNAQLVALVDHVPTGIDQVIEAANAVGGFLASRTDNSVTIRVPVARFREALGRVESLSTVTSRNVQAEDITEAFHDLEVRLANLRSVQARLQQFLARANNVTEALSVEHELERVGQQIDEIEGRMRFLANRAAFSTITVTLTARPQANTVNPNPSPLSYPSIPDTSLPFEVLEQLGLPRLLTAR